MRVSLSYSVDIDNVPEEIIRLIQSSQNFNVEQNKQRLIELIRKKNTLLAIEDIQTMRKQMSELDRRLDECSSILRGYTNAVAKPEIVEQPAALPPSYDDDGE